MNIYVRSQITSEYIQERQTHNFKRTQSSAKSLFKNIYFYFQFLISKKNTKKKKYFMGAVWSSVQINVPIRCFNQIFCIACFPVVNFYSLFHFLSVYSIYVIQYIHSRYSPSRSCKMIIQFSNLKFIYISHHCQSH